MQKSKLEVFFHTSPANNKERTFFTICMCTMMVTIMSIYNAVTHNQSMTFDGFKNSYLPSLVFALFLDIFIIGKIVRKIMEIIPHKTNFPMAVKRSFFTVLGMSSSMTLYGVLVSGSLLSSYPANWAHSIVFSIPLNILLVGPFNRTILNKIQTKTAA